MDLLSSAVAQSHGVIFGLQGALKLISFHLPLAEVAPTPLQPVLEHFQVWGTPVFLGSPCQGLPSHREEFLPNIQFNPAVWQWETILSCHSVSFSKVHLQLS